jgi:hypothetical protein
MEAVSTSETSLNFYQTTRRNNPENSHIYVSVQAAATLYVMKFVTETKMGRCGRKTAKWRKTNLVIY